MKSSSLPDLDHRMQQIRRSVIKHLGFELRQGQEIASRELLGRCVVEMPTGEGKTVAMVFPAATLASRCSNVLVVTANDYLASRDANWMRPIYRDIGLSVGCVSAISSKSQRREAYQCSVTYGTLKEFCFDFLRASLATREGLQARELPEFSFDALMVDEADSVLIDEARMPMVITSPTKRIDEKSECCFRWCAEFAKSLQSQVDFVQIAETGEIALTEEGNAKFARASMPSSINTLTTTEILHSLERAIWVNQNMRTDHDYMISDDVVCLVDEHTGRKSSDRKFGSGIQQAIEAREGLQLTPESQPIARISVQEFVGKFKHLSGITATIFEDRHELRSVYGLNVKTVNPHKSSLRKELQPQVARSDHEKWRQIAEETIAMIEQNRAVLIGTCSIAQSEELSRDFGIRGIKHVVLNAKNHEQEATFIAQAGQPKHVTIATNMAGRGTDIPLSNEVADAGGLHVIVSQLHAAKRIDRQLQGRCARAGDPGSTRVYICPNDRIFLQALGAVQANKLAATAQQSSDAWLRKQAERAQRLVAASHRKQRDLIAQREQEVAQALTAIGLDPHLDPLPSDT